jgi:hypothetical protein
MRARTSKKWMSQGVGWVREDQGKTGGSHHLLSSRRRLIPPIYLSTSRLSLSFFFLLFLSLLLILSLLQHTTHAHSHHRPHQQQQQQQHPSCRHNPQEHPYRHPALHDSTCLQPLDYNSNNNSQCPGRHYTADSNRSYTMNLLNNTDALSLAKVCLLSLLGDQLQPQERLRFSFFVICNKRVGDRERERAEKNGKGRVHGGKRGVKVSRHWGGFFFFLQFFISFHHSTIAHSYAMS